jgi:hypothetical protein
VYCKGTTIPGDVTFDVDRVIAATGFGTPLRDLPDMGLTTFSQGRLPGQTAYWESASVPGIFFAGSITQGSIGLKKYGRPSGSASVHGARYNARVLAEHLATTRFGVKVEQPVLEPDDVVPYLLREMSHAPELWNQQAYLARVVSFDGGRGIVDQGIVPLAHFVDSGGPDAVAATVETSEHGEIRPAVYIRRGGSVDEQIMEGTLQHDYDTPEHHRHLSGLLKPMLG